MGNNSNRDRIESNTQVCVISPPEDIDSDAEASIFSSLPMELVFIIWEYVPTVELIESMVLVCKWWRLAILDTKSAWKYVMDRTLVKTDEALSVLTAQFYHKKIWSLQHCVSLRARGFTSLCKNVSTLKVLDVTGCIYFDNECLKAIVTSKHCSSLTSLLLAGTSITSDGIITLTQCVNLSTLDLRRVKKERVANYDFLNTLTSLTDLDITKYSYNPDFQCVSNLVNLKRLAVDPTISPIKHLKKLTKLKSLGTIQLVSFDDLDILTGLHTLCVIRQSNSHVLTRLTKINDLSIHYNEKLGGHINNSMNLDTLFGDILPKMDRLESLELIKYNNRIRNDLFPSLKKLAPKLRHLKAHDAFNDSSNGRYIKILRKVSPGITIEY